MSVQNWLGRLRHSIARSRQIRGANYIALSTCERETGRPKCRMVVFRGFLEHEQMRQRLEQQQMQVTLSGDGDEGSYINGTNGESDLHHVRFKMVTDARSRKVKESDECEVCWWFAKTSEQYRVSGKLRFVGENDNDEKLVRQRHGEWKKLRDNAKDQFYWDYPGAVFSGVVDNEMGEESLNHGSSKAAQHDNPADEAIVADAVNTTHQRDDPPSNFLLMLLDPERIDHLCLKTDVRIIDERIVPELASTDDTPHKWTTYRVNP